MNKTLVMLMAAVVMFAPAGSALVSAQSTGPPPVAPPLVREGDFALKLQPQLGLGFANDEIEAETQLGNSGISPRNGWMADYPVTPDILGELQDSVGNAAAAGKLRLSREEALKRLNEVYGQFDISFAPYTGGGYTSPPPNAENYPNPSVVTEYYEEEGPPVVTYYTPPPGYYYLYTWVPYPFWCCGFWFSGFFVLHDFHRSVIVHNRVVFVSNHFNDLNRHRVFRVDPVQRFHGRTFAGIGAPPSRNFISTGVPRSDREIFNAPRPSMPQGSRGQRPPQGASRGGAQPMGPSGGAPPGGPSGTHSGHSGSMGGHR